MPVYVNTNSMPQAAAMPTMSGVAPSGGMGASVWGSSRGVDRTHAAERVDKLASSGMDDFEIPAFLRKQAD